MKKVFKVLSCTLMVACLFSGINAASAAEARERPKGRITDMIKENKNVKNAEKGKDETAQRYKKSSDRVHNFVPKKSSRATTDHSESSGESDPKKEKKQ